MSEAVRAELLYLERELMQLEVRSNSTRVGEMLAPEFVEIGSSGRFWSRAEILALLAEEQQYEQPQVEDFQLRLLAPEIALVAYRSISASRGTTIRSSIWQRRGERWQCVFHQGTPQGTQPGMQPDTAAPQTPTE